MNHETLSGALIAWMFGPDGRCEEPSAGLRAYTGRAVDHFATFVHPDDLARLGPAATVRLLRHDGAYRWFRLAIADRLVVATDVHDLHDALHHATERLDTLAGQVHTMQRIANIGSWSLDIATGVVVWSDELYRIFGLPPDQPAPRFDQQQPLWAPDSWIRLRAAAARCRETGVGYELVLGAQRSDGEMRITIARGAAVRDAHGSIVGLAGTLQDITAREHAAEALALASERLELATTAAKVAVWDWDISSDRLFWDRSMYELYEAPRTSLAYDNWRRALHPEDRDRAEGELAVAVGGGPPFDTTFRIVTTKGVKHLRAVRPCIATRTASPSAWSA